MAQMDLRRKGWTFSAAARQDAIEWMKQHSVRSLFEHMTSELLQEHPDDPMLFLVQLLERRFSKDTSYEEDEAARDHLRATTAQQQFLTESQKAELAEEIRKDISRIQAEVQEQDAEAARLEAEIAALQG